MHIDIEQSDTFRKWLMKLKDRRAKVTITGRISRLASGLPGDVKPVGNGLSELRIDYGPGYRVYYQNQGDRLILLLCGGDKGSQNRDIAKAKQIAKEWSAKNG
ncbi:type II toxin-antitoxin system RelE/ParE family toxin [Halomonas sp. SpR1]|uniref:type II toxin-antitoxin system RelE/ParE family toxin n=1 Tax=Halomonas sp. SpR1 TaxID=3050462 RepID=UPI0027E59E0D|nr:type II toxin-antitoxin system RelE/ParE family toxin [Halomonas sp. SpR1]MDQ7735720.1 type II toxin-antitoxin system RelE/ParE family toxin [Halomonas sp. SpR1]